MEDADTAIYCIKKEADTCISPYHFHGFVLLGVSPRYVYLNHITPPQTRYIFLKSGTGSSEINKLTTIDIIRL